MQHRANLRPSKNTLATRAGLVAVAAGKSVPMTQTELTNLLLTKVPLFEGFEPAVVAEITAGSELCTFEGNEAIVECGDPGLFLGVLVSGHAEVSVPDNTGGRVTVGQLQDGDVFGEAPMLTGDRTRPTSSPATAASCCRSAPGSSTPHLLTQPKAIARLSKLLAERARAQSTDPAAAGDGRPARRIRTSSASRPTTPARSWRSTSASPRSVSASTTRRTSASTSAASSSTATDGGAASG